MLDEKLLSIAIPTYNRAGILNHALELLVSQLIDLKGVELIISDNNSADNTRAIMESWKSRYPSLISVFYQKSNTGFYGNFRKCKELAKGKYIWILSDDDHVVNGAIEKVYSVLRDCSPDVLFLDNKLEADSIEKSKCTLDELVLKKNLRLTLISATIFQNSLTCDAEVFEQFRRSSFIGFALLISIRSKSTTATILSNKIFNERKARPGGYNYYKVFVIEMSDIFKYMNSVSYKKEGINAIKRNILLKLILKRYVYQKLYGKLDGSLKTFSIPMINKLIHKYYKSFLSYWLLFLPLTLLPGFHKSSKIINKSR